MKNILTLLCALCVLCGFSARAAETLNYKKAGDRELRLHIEKPADNLKISCKPDALVLFNPVFNNGPGQWGYERVGQRFKEFSPAHNITTAAPPTIVFLGDEDKLIPIIVLREFENQMKKVGARCDAHVYPMAGHGFFNRDPHFTLTLVEADKFLTSLGWLTGSAAKQP